MPFTPPLTSAAFAVFFGLFGVFLTVRVVLNRVKFKIVGTDGGHAPLIRAIRAHGNFTEQTPLALILLTLAELIRAPHLAILLLGTLLVIARILSFWGITHLDTATRAREAGAGMTMFYHVALCLVICYTLCFG